MNGFLNGHEKTDLTHRNGGVIQINKKLSFYPHFLLKHGSGGRRHLSELLEASLLAGLTMDYGDEGDGGWASF